MGKIEPTTERELQLFHGLDIKERSIDFGRPLDIKEDDNDPGVVDDISVGIAIRQIKFLLSINKDPISIYMSSPGGDIYAMLRFIDFIKSCPCTIKFYGSGRIMSAGSLIMVSCDERYVSENTAILIHDGYGDMGTVTPTDESIEHKETIRIKNISNKIFSENTIMPEEYWGEVCKRDTIITPEEAIVLGMVDEIIPSKKDSEYSKKKQINLGIKRNKKILEATINKIYDRIESPLKNKQTKQIKRKDFEGSEVDDAIKGTLWEELLSASQKIKK